MNPKVLPWITSCWRVHRVHPFLTLCARRLQDQAKQIKELKEHLSSNEHVKAPSETQASSTSESLCAEVEQAREREELWKMCARNKISYTSFEPGDCALFLPTSSGCAPCGTSLYFVRTHSRRQLIRDVPAPAYALRRLMPALCSSFSSPNQHFLIRTHADFFFGLMPALAPHSHFPFIVCQDSVPDSFFLPVYVEISSRSIGGAHSDTSPTSPCLLLELTLDAKLNTSSDMSSTRPIALSTHTHANTHTHYTRSF